MHKICFVLETKTKSSTQQNETKFEMKIKHNYSPIYIFMLIIRCTVIIIKRFQMRFLDLLIIFQRSL